MTFLGIFDVSLRHLLTDLYKSNKIPFNTLLEDTPRKNEWSR